MVFNPSHKVVISIIVVALASLVLGLATDVGLFGWSFSLVLALYLAIAGVAHVTRQRTPA
jgi:uncharacterized membrane protein YphA (DoxX/SURF4 family)